MPMACGQSKRVSGLTSFVDKTRHDYIREKLMQINLE